MKNPAALKQPIPNLTIIAVIPGVFYPTHGE